MPAPITYSHRLVEQQAFIRKSGKLSWLRPDAKSQVSFVYGDDGKPESISAVVLSTQHDPDYIDYLRGLGMGQGLEGTHQSPGEDFEYSFIFSLDDVSGSAGNTTQRKTLSQ